MFRTLCPALLLSTCPLAAADFPVPFNTEPGDPSPMPAAEAAASMQLPEGFRCQLFASEPMVQQPIAIDFDSQQRLWVAECYTFAEQPLRWELNLRDRITILEDTDQDGSADQRTVFWDAGQRLTGIAVTEDGVYALCSPQLLFIPDANHDLVPDGPPVVILDGFDFENIGHNIVNGLRLGPDGWLYGRHGITATSQVGTPGTPPAKRTALNCSIWRYHPATRSFEVFCNGGTNPWGLDWAANGQLFYTNTVIGHLWHAIPGAYYERMFGAHLRPHVYEIIEHTADHVHWDNGSEKWSDIRTGITSRTSELGGGHAHMGCLIYHQGNWPAAYQDMLFTCNLHGNRINMDVLNRDGCGYTASHGKDFMQAQDTWFRGLDLIQAADGSVYVNDWSDTGECHDNDGIHRTSGRIYRIVYDGPDATALPAHPVAAFQHLRRQSQCTPETLATMLEHADEGVRALGVRWLAEDSSGTDRSAALAAASTDPSGLVRLEVAAALQRLPIPERLPVAELLAAHAEDAADRQQPLMIWYGIEPAVAADPDAAIDLLSQSPMRTLGRLISRRLTELIETQPEAVAELVRLASTSPEDLPDVVEGMSQALAGWSSTTAPEGWSALSAQLKAHSDEVLQTWGRDLDLVFGSGRPREELLATLDDLSAPDTARRQALTSLLRDPTGDLLPLLKKLLNDKVVSREAVEGVAFYDDPASFNSLVQHWNRRSENRDAVMATLCSRPSAALILLRAIERDVLPTSAITPFHARSLQSLSDPTVTRLLTQIWGETRETPEEKQALLAKWKTALNPETLATADPQKGRLLFNAACASCHQLYGEGGQIGPDLTGSDRQNIDYLLGNIIDPSGVVPADYFTTVIHLDDGRTLTGVIPEQTERTLTLQTPVARLILEKSTITRQESLPVSLMPEGLLEAMGEEAARHLVAYLMSLNQVPVSDL